MYALYKAYRFISSLSLVLFSTSLSVISSYLSKKHLSMSNDWVFSPSDIELTSTILGRGAFGEVRVAKWRNIEIACKSLHISDSSSPDRSQIDLESWRHEIEMLSKLRHPNLVLFLGVCESPSQTLILTELLPCSLYDVLEVNKTELLLPDILDISLDIANGLDYLHKHNPPIVHRDISAKNILIGGNRTKIADLGQAKIFGHNTLSRQTGMPGAMAYSAPEVLTGKYSSKIDIFSYGILVAQMCSGEYPRIDRREEQIALSCDRHPIFKPIITSMVSYQPHERPTAEFICSTIETFKANDRNYPLSRRTQPEKDLGILGRHWMQTQIDRQCQEVNTELLRTKSLLAAEEARWRLEAGKVDGINDQLRQSQQDHARTQEKLERLQLDCRELQHKLSQSDSYAGDLKAQMQFMSSEIQRQNGTIPAYELQLAQQSQDVHACRDALSRYQDEYQVAAQLLDASRRSEADSNKRNEQLRQQLDMQVDYVRDLETRLEQALTRWKLEKDALREEKARYGKLSNHSAAIVAINERQSQDVARYEARLKLYADLPMPEEIKERFKDIQDDAQMARDELNQLLRQRDEWSDLKVTLDQTIADYKNHTDELNNQLLERDHEILNRTEELGSLRQELAGAYQQTEDRNSRVAELEAEIAAMKESEVQLNDTLRKTRVALTKEKSRVELYRQVSTAAVIAPGNTQAAPQIQDAAPPISAAARGETLERSNVVSGEEQPRIGSPQGERPGSPYILQQDLRLEATEAGRRDITDLDDEDAAPAGIRSLVPSVTRLAEMQVIVAQMEIETAPTDVGIKHMVNAVADKQGAPGLIKLMQGTQNQDERIIWRGARALRELILKDEAIKAVCYDSNVDDWLTRLIDLYPDSSIVQGHTMRLVGALAFGNDRYRRKAGEKGVMTVIAKALERHSEDETAMLHASTAITNLTHNSMENRSRFVEEGGVDLLVGMMIRFKESAKLQRQACWAVLSLCGTDEISRSIALRGGDSAILNAMLHHRYDAGVQQFGCWALSNLALSGEEVARKMKKKGAVEVCRIAIETHPKNAEVLRQARNAMGAFSPLPSSGNPPPVGASGSNHMMYSTSTSAL